VVSAQTQGERRVLSPRAGMIYGSVCSGIEAATVAWEPLGFQPAWFAEIDQFCSALLAHHYPKVENRGDFTQINDTPSKIDILVGGTPCQSFSVSGRRGGLDDARGNLALEFCRLASRLRPRWIVWENVPGVLSSNGGRDFGAILGALADVGYGCAWRVLDAQFFGVSQRRRRVFVVGYLGDWRRAAAVLLEREGLCRHTPPRRTTREEVTGDSVCGAEIGPSGGRFTQLAPTLDARCKDSVIRNQIGLLVFGGNNRRQMVVRRLTPRECERLQGFPDDYTLIPYRGKPATDSPRYRAIGNSMAVPVMHWIGRRIQNCSSGD
jgi:DNA (cytosine-5)-methyltransferase 1